MSQRGKDHGKTGPGSTANTSSSPSMPKQEYPQKDWCAAQGLNYSSAKRYIKVTTYGANSQKLRTNLRIRRRRRAGPVKQEGEKNQPDTGTRSKSPETKPIRGSRTAPPTNAFQPGNQNALKHGGYGRRMLLSDAITEDAQMLTLDDELFWRRAAPDSGREYRALADRAGDSRQRAGQRSARPYLSGAESNASQHCAY